MKKVLLFLLICVGSKFSFSQSEARKKLGDWLFIEKNSNNDSIFLKTTAIGSDHNVIKVWVKMVWGSKKRAEFPGKNLCETQSLALFDCIGQQYLDMQRIDYNTKGKILSMQQGDPYNRKWQQTPKGSLMDKTMDAACLWYSDGKLDMFEDFK